MSLLSVQVFEDVPAHHAASSSMLESVFLCYGFEHYVLSLYWRNSQCAVQ